MKESNLIFLWKEQSEKINQSLAINQRLLRETLNQKAEKALNKLIRLKTTGIITGILYLLFLGLILFYAIAHYSSASNYFIISIGAIFLVNIKAVYDYIMHLVLVNKIDYNGSVIEIQQQLSTLQISIINHAKVMCLQFPFYTTFYLSNKWFPQEIGWGYIVFQICLTGSFTYLSYWLYKNHTIENLNKKWFRNMIAGSGGKSVLKAMDFYKELEEFKSN